MARGVVPLVSNVGDLPWMVDGGKAGYIAKPGDVADLTDVLIRALGEDRTKKAASARAYAQKTLSWDAQAKLVSDMLADLEREGK
jgi:glycosyltransferase involved in cell wall biosynthesis